MVCPAGSYCDGTTKTDCPPNFTSDKGTTSILGCYTDCGGYRVGRFYYSDDAPPGYGFDTCTVASCDKGYTLEEYDPYNRYYYDDEANTNVGYPVLFVTFPDDEVVYVDNDGVYHEGRYFGLSRSDVGLKSANTFAVVSSDKGMIVRGLAACSVASGSSDSDNGTYIDLNKNAGPNCYCKIESSNSNIYPAKWVYNKGFSSTSDCESGCAESCAHALSRDSGSPTEFQRKIAMSGLQLNGCSANTINVTWQDAATGTIRATSFTYGGNIDTPSVAPTKTGKTFLGWKFSKTSN